MSLSYVSAELVYLELAER